MDTTTSSNLSTSPATTPGSSMSVQAYTSQFIKEGLRIKMRQKMGSGGNESGGSTQGMYCPIYHLNNYLQLHVCLSFHWFVCHTLGF